MLMAVGGSCRLEIKPVSADSRGDSGGGIQYREWKAIPTPEGRPCLTDYAGGRTSVVKKLDEGAIAPSTSGVLASDTQYSNFATRSSLWGEPDCGNFDPPEYVPDIRLI